ncbi:MAG: site-specific recombinase [Proteobacteria bacterium]|nr:site-specific recombinase [Pseudomonadota bacterium]
MARNKVRQLASTRWDLTALLNAANPKDEPTQRHLWLIHLVQWLRIPGPEATQAVPEPDAGTTATPWPVRRLRHLLNVLDRHPDHRQRVGELLHVSLAELDATGLLADFGFASRTSFMSELSERLRLKFLPGTPQTHDLGELFLLLLQDEEDALWVEAIDEATLARLVALCVPDAKAMPWKDAMVESIQLLASQLRASGLSSAMRQRMARELLVDRPFHQVVQAAEALRSSHLDGEAGGPALLQQAQYLRAVLGACRAAAASVSGHLDEHGISVDVVFQVDRIRARASRIERLLNCLVSPHPLMEMRALVARLVRAGVERRGVRALFKRHYALLARKVTERSAETGEHYITRDMAGYKTMLGQAMGGGALIGFTTLIKFGITALGLSLFWTGFWAGFNYALSFVLIYLLHGTVATKQPAMTAPSMAAKLENVSASDAAVESFVDEVTHLIRTQTAGILGNVIAVAPVALALQLATLPLLGHPLVGVDSAHHTLAHLTLWGPTLLYAAFTGVLLFGASLIAGWTENWFVLHRLDSAIAWNPRFTRLLGAQRAQHWARWWRDHISSLAANVSLGFMLGLVPVFASFFGLPLEVRHVTLSTGQIAVAAGALGWEVVHEPTFWWCVAAIPLTGALNVAVSFALAFRVALASRSLRNVDRGRIYKALRQRLWRAPRSFVWPINRRPWGPP